MSSSSAAPLVGSAHVVSSAPRLARALGYDVDSALEAVDPDTAVARRRRRCAASLPLG